MSLDDEIFANQLAREPKKRSISLLSFLKRGKSRRPQTQQPVSYVPKPKRQAPKAVQNTASFYSDVLRVLHPIGGAVNGLILVIMIVWFIKGTPTFSLVGLALGVALVLFELFLFSKVDDLHHKEKTSRTNLALMGFLGLVMFGTVGYVAYRWFVFVPSVLVVVALFMALTGPLSSVDDSAKEASIRERVDAEVAELKTFLQSLANNLGPAAAELNAMLPNVSQTLADANQTASHATTLLGVFTNQEEYLDRQVKAQVTAEKPALIAQLRIEYQRVVDEQTVGLRQQLRDVTQERDDALRQLEESSDSESLPGASQPQPSAWSISGLPPVPHYGGVHPSADPSRTVIVQSEI